MNRTGRKTRPPASGFTLLEMLAALVLSGLLIMGIGQVLRSAVFQSKQARAEFRNQPALRRLTEQLRRDIQNARGWDYRRSALILDGFCGTNPQTQLPTHEPAIVTYRTIKSSDGNWLVRDERHSNNPSATVSSDALFAGIRSIIIETSDPISDTPSSNGMTTLPLRMRVLLLGTDDIPLLDQDFQTGLEVQ